MDDRLKDGLRIGNFVIVPKSGTISGAQGTHRLSADRIEMLVLLAEHAGKAVTIEQLATEAGLDAEADRATIDRHIEAIRESLDDTGPKPRFVVVDDDGITLIAPVHEGVGNWVGQDDDDDVSFLKQLQRRKVIRVGAGYIVLAWVAIQVSDVILPALGAAPWILTLAIAIALLGFPLAIIGAWVFEVTPTGTIRDERRAPASLTRRQKIIDVGVIFCLVLVVGYLAVSVFSDARRARDTAELKATSTRVTADANTVAVLPFETMGGDEDNAYIGDGIADEILRKLSRLRELRVTARTASFYFDIERQHDIDSQTIAERLQVRNLLTGRIQIVGDNIRVTTELFDASDGQLLWTHRYDRDLEDIFEIQEEIALAVAGGTTDALSATSNAHLAVRPTESLEAYDFYLRGRDYLFQPRTSDVLENAQRLFHRALALDPDYALALAGICETHLAVYIRTRSVATIDDAESVCQAALEIDPSLPEVHTALGYLYYNTGDFEKAEREFRTAISKDPNFFEAYAGLGDTLASQDDMDAAEQQFINLVNLQPAYWRGYQKLGGFYYRLGRDDKALPNFARVTDLSPDNAPGWNNLGAVHFMLGNLEGAAIAWKQAIDIEPTQSMYSNLGTLYYYLGRYDDSVDMQSKAIELAPNDYRMWGRRAGTYFQMPGKEAEAQASYSRAIALAEEILEINPNESDVLKQIALFYSHIDQATQARQTMERALALSPQDPDTHFFAALTYLMLDERERSLEALETAVSLGYSKKMIRTDPALAALQGTDRFRVLSAEEVSAAASE